MHSCSLEGAIALFRDNTAALAEFALFEHVWLSLVLADFCLVPRGSPSNVVHDRTPHSKRSRCCGSTSSWTPWRHWLWPPSCRQKNCSSGSRTVVPSRSSLATWRRTLSDMPSTNWPLFSPYCLPVSATFPLGCCHLSVCRVWVFICVVFSYHSRGLGLYNVTVHLRYQ